LFLQIYSIEIEKFFFFYWVWFYYATLVALEI
jgi:hypothetical protein